MFTRFCAVLLGAWMIIATLGVVALDHTDPVDSIAALVFIVAYVPVAIVGAFLLALRWIIFGSGKNLRY